MHYCQLSLEERRKLAKWREAGVPVAEIAARLSRNPSTIHREINRNSYFDDELPELNGYYAINAQSKADARRAVHRKMITSPALKAHVERQLKAGWSPEQIAGRMKLEGNPQRVSHETIYRFAYSMDGRAEQFYRHLPEHRRRRRPRGMRRRHGQRFSPERGILRRPDTVAARHEFGHWECDLMLFRREHGKTNVSTIVERVSRYTVLRKNADRTSRPVMDRVAGALMHLPGPARRSITFDRGTEFTAWPALEEQLGARAWFCDPQAPWQKGTVENTNNRLRRHMPRDADPTAFTDRHLISICDRLNSTPRKCLGYLTPAEVFKRNLLAIRNGEE
jgi:IS30 family transposase